VNKLALAWKAGSSAQATLSAFENIGMDIAATTPQDFAEFIRAEASGRSSLVRRLGIKLN